MKCDKFHSKSIALAKLQPNTRAIAVMLSLATIMTHQSAAFVPPNAKIMGADKTKIWTSSLFSPTIAGTFLRNSKDDNDSTEEDKRAKYFDELTKNLFESNTNGENGAANIFTRSNPFEAGVATSGGKGALYNEEELMNLLATHQNLSDDIIGSDTTAPSTSESGGILSIHDLVMNTIEEDNTDSSDKSNTGISPDLKQKSKTIRAIASDVDGTILTSEQTIHPITRNAIKQAVGLAMTSSTSTSIAPFFFFPATGKSREGALSSLGYEMSTLLTQSNVPGVYLQGLFCVDGNQNVVFEKKLTKTAIAAVEEIVQKEQLSIVGYDGDFLCTTEQTEIVKHLHEHYGEPMPALLEGNKMLSEHPPLLHKILIMDDDTKKLSEIIRPQLEALVEEYDVTITQAIPTMLEVLPAGCSKAVGVQKVCEALGIDMETELLALGDAENDAEMLKMAQIGVAMGNGCPMAKSSANYVMQERNDEGGAGLAIEMFGLERLKAK